MERSNIGKGVLSGVLSRDHWVRRMILSKSKDEIFGFTFIPSKCKHCKSEGFGSCGRPSNLTQIGFKSSIFQPV